MKKQIFAFVAAVLAIFILNLFKVPQFIIGSVSITSYFYFLGWLKPK